MTKNKKQKPVTSNKLNNPFGALKGFAVGAAEQSAPAPKKPAAEPRSAAEEVDFDEQMARFGVQRLNAETSVKDQENSGQSAEVEGGAGDCDQNEFLTAMKSLNVSFEDAYSLEEESPQPTPRRMKQLRNGTLVPEATLDLHGSARQDVAARLTSFIANARYHGRHVLLVITGKGLHSPEGQGVLRSAVEDFLQRSANDQVAEWGRAPRQYGGDGAIVLFLRRQRE